MPVVDPLSTVMLLPPHPMTSSWFAALQTTATRNSQLLTGSTSQALPFQRYSNPVMWQLKLNTCHGLSYVSISPTSNIPCIGTSYHLVITWLIESLLSIIRTSPKICLDQIPSLALQILTDLRPRPWELGGRGASQNWKWKPNYGRGQSKSDACFLTLGECFEVWSE